MANTLGRAALIGLLLILTDGLRAAPLTEPQRQMAEAFAAPFATLCPWTDPTSQDAFNACRQALARGEAWNGRLGPRLRWGGADLDKPLKDATLTGFDGELWTRLYLPLFMFGPGFEASYDEREERIALTLPVRFRNQLPPGQYPYPFWHSAAKWDAYQDADRLTFFIDPRSGLADTVLRRRLGAPLALAERRLPPAFDGNWTWLDAAGQAQPRVTLFEDRFSADNPFLPALDAAYRQFALSLRDTTCLNCHVPNNPKGLKTLLLLQTPAHAAGEIERALKAVRENKMPETDWGGPKPLEAAQREAFLERGGAFAAALAQAIDWQSRHDRH